MSRPEGGSRGPIRRFPPGFWQEFNQWWHAEYARAGHRPSSKNIARWHAENAVSVWGRDMVSYAETQRHANRMKCRRSMHGTSGHGNRSWDEEEEDEDAEEAEDDDRDEDVGQPPNKVPASSSAVGLDLNPHSDVPGALLGGVAAFNADSDVPEPAAERANKRRHMARAASRTLPSTSSADDKPTYMQPDPVGPTGPRACTCDAGMNWDSGITIRSGPAVDGEHSGSFLHNAIPSVHSTALPAVCRQLGNPAAVNPASACESAAFSHADKKPRLAAPAPTASPFADMAAAAAASAGLPSAASLPAARDAAALLACGGKQDTAAQQHPAPAWLASAGLELHRLMHELGIAAAAPAALTARPSRALSSRDPLCLPPPRAQRDLDGLLLRSSTNGRGSSGCGGGLQLPQHSAAGPHRASSGVVLSGTPRLGCGVVARGGELAGVAVGQMLQGAGAPGLVGVQGGVLRQQQQHWDCSWRGGGSGGQMNIRRRGYYMQDLL